MTSELHIAAPFTGTAVAMSSVPDPVFSQEIVGPGIALLAPSGAIVTVLAPISGVITAVFPHAFSVENESGHNVLVHLGIDTVELRGNGFTQHASVGQRVTQGEPLIEWETSVAEQAGYSLVCPIVAVQAERADVSVEVADSSEIQAGSLVARWAIA